MTLWTTSKVSQRFGVGRITGEGGGVWHAARSCRRAGRLRSLRTCLGSGVICSRSSASVVGGWLVGPWARRRVIVLIAAQQIMAPETAERRDGSLRGRDVLGALRPCLARERCSEPS